MVLFDERFRAGRKLSKQLENRDIDVLVMPFKEAEEVVRGIEEEIDVKTSAMMSAFISAPGDSRINIGAVAGDGTLWIADPLREEFQVSADYIGRTARTKTGSLNYNYERSEMKGKNVAVVSDGVSSGFREAAVAGSLRKRGAKNVYVAAPVVSKNMMADLNPVIDGILCMERVPFLSDPDACYGRSSQDRLKSATVNRLI